MANHRSSGRCFIVALVTSFVLALGWSTLAVATDDAQSKTADGITVYLGIVPAEIVKGLSQNSGERSMHGGIPAGRHQYHLLAAIFDTASGARISNAEVTAQVSGIGLSGVKKNLDPMQIANTVTYGNFFNLPGADRYTITLTVRRPPAQRPAILDFTYGHLR